MIEEETIWVIVIILLFIMLIFFYSDSIKEYKYKVVEGFENGGDANIYYLTKDEVWDLIDKDYDNYFNTFTIYDLEARDIKSIDEYKNIIKNNLGEISGEKRLRLSRMMEEADRRLNKIRLEYFDGKKCGDIPWRIGYIKNNKYEDGLPHTRNQVIFISDKVIGYNDETLIGTLIHEKVHIYQRLYPEDMERYKDKKGYKVWKRRDINDRIRANPDTDMYIYKNGKDEIMKTEYREGARGVEDVITYPKDEQSYEHPNETMAIEIERIK